MQISDSNLCYFSRFIIIIQEIYYTILRATGAGYILPDSPSFQVLVSKTENCLLAAVFSDSFHVLRPIFRLSFLDALASENVPTLSLFQLKNLSLDPYFSPLPLHVHSTCFSFAPSLSSLPLLFSVIFHSFFLSFSYSMLFTVYMSCGRVGVCRPTVFFI